MKRKIAFLLIACTLLLTACTREAKNVQTSPTATVQSTAAPDLPQTSPDPSQPIMSDKPLVDGEYAAEVSDAYVQSDGHGWKEYLKITVKNQQITDLEYDALKDGKKKSEATAEEYPMSPPPGEWTVKINDALRVAEVPEAMDTVSGATMSSRVARLLYAAVLEAARTGSSETVIVDI